MHNARGRQTELLLNAESESDRERWLSALRPPTVGFHQFFLCWLLLLARRRLTISLIALISSIANDHFNLFHLFLEVVAP